MSHLFGSAALERATVVSAVGRQRAIAAEVRGTDWLVEGTCLFTTEGTEEGLGLAPSALKVVSGRLQYKRRSLPCFGVPFRTVGRLGTG